MLILLLPTCYLQVEKMFAFSVLTPYYEEEVIYSLKDLDTQNEDGITTLFYLQKVFPGKFSNRNSSSPYVVDSFDF